MPERLGPPWERRWGPPVPGGVTGRHMFRRVAGFVLFLVLTGILAGALIATGMAAIRGPTRWVIVALTLIGLTGFALVARRLFRRSWAPVGDLIDATRRLGQGEHTVRLAVHRPGPFAAVAGSFNKMAERLEEEDRRRRALLADIGHELRTPMTVIRGEVEAVLDGLHEPSQLSNVIDEIDLIDRLLDDLRVLSMAESGMLRLEIEPTDLDELVRSVVDSYSNLTADQGVRVTIEASGHLDDIEIDPHRIHQVVSNLVSNALRHMPKGGSLDILVRDDPGVSVIEVADSGPGIADEDLARVFERFARSADSTGTGLGLSISRDLVTAHGGEIVASNRASGGAVFTVTLPRA